MTSPLNRAGRPARAFSLDRPSLSRPPVASVTVPVSNADDTETGGVAFAVFSFYTFILLAKPQDYFPALERLRPALALTVISLLVTAFTNRGSFARIFRTRATKLYLLFFVAMLGGIPFSLHVRYSFDFILFGYIVNVLYFLLFLIHVDTLAKFRRIVLVVAISGLTFAGLALQFGSFASGRYFAQLGLRAAAASLGSASIE